MQKRDRNVLVAAFRGKREAATWRAEDRKSGTLPLTPSNP
jgi:hypothetical protein